MLVEVGPLTRCGSVINSDDIINLSTKPSQKRWLRTISRDGILKLLSEGCIDMSVKRRPLGILHSRLTK